MSQDAIMKGVASPSWALRPLHVPTRHTIWDGDQDTFTMITQFVFWKLQGWHAFNFFPWSLSCSDTWQLLEAQNKNLTQDYSCTTLVKKHIKAYVCCRPWTRWSLGEGKCMPEPTDVEKSADELWLGVKCHSNLKSSTSWWLLSPMWEMEHLIMHIHEAMLLVVLRSFSHSMMCWTTSTSLHVRYPKSNVHF